jgi:outer membrane protein
MRGPIFLAGRRILRAFLNPVRLLLVLVCLAASPALGEQLPLWEAGVGIGSARIPHYRGSNQYRTWVLPVPYIVYRGEILKLDENRYRGLFYRSDRAELDISLSGSPPARNDEARRGMPDLDATFEVGPTFNLSLLGSKSSDVELELRVPVRTVIATDLSRYRYTGWVFQPNLDLTVRGIPGFSGWEFGLRGGLIFTDRRYNQYFYAVDPVFATPDRSAYSTGGGYAGPSVTASLSKHFAKFWVGGFAKWDSVSGAVFEDSPLVKAKTNFTAGFALAWILSVSPEKVEAEH